LRSRYADGHPKVRQALRRIEALEVSLSRGEPAELRAARAELAELQIHYGKEHPKVREAIRKVDTLEYAARVQADGRRVKPIPPKAHPSTRAAAGPARYDVRVTLPECDRQPMMLDLASRQVIRAPDVDEDKILSAIDAGGKGDLVYEQAHGKQVVVCLRGASASTDPEDGRRVEMKVEKEGSDSASMMSYCHLPMPLPCSILMTTREGRRFRVTFSKADKEQAEVQMEELAGVPAAASAPVKSVPAPAPAAAPRSKPEPEMAPAADPAAGFAADVVPEPVTPRDGVVEQALRTGQWLDLYTGRPLRPADVSSSRPVVMATEGRPAALAFHGGCATMLLDSKRWDDPQWQTLAVDVAERELQFGRPTAHTFAKELGRQRELLNQRQGVLRAAEEKLETARVTLEHGQPRYELARTLHRAGKLSQVELSDAAKVLGVAKVAAQAGERAVSELTPEVKRLSRRVADAQDLFAGTVMRRDVIREQGHAEVRLIKGPLPRTYGIATQSDVMGLLQVIERSGAAGDVRIRYRMVRPGENQ